MNTEEQQIAMKQISKVLDRFYSDLQEEEYSEDVIMSYILNDGVVIAQRVADEEVLVKMYIGTPTFLNLDLTEKKEQFCPHMELYQLTKKFMKDNSVYDLDTVLQSESMMNRLDDFNSKVFEIMRDELESDA